MFCRYKKCWFFKKHQYFSSNRIIKLEYTFSRKKRKMVLVFSYLFLCNQVFFLWKLTFFPMSCNNTNVEYFVKQSKTEIFRESNNFQQHKPNQSKSKFVAGPNLSWKIKSVISIFWFLTIPQYGISKILFSKWYFVKSLFCKVTNLPW